MTACWRDVSNAGGAVGFPYLPVTDDDVVPAVDELVASLDPVCERLLVATIEGTLAGWVVLSGNSWRVTRHWATVRRLQTALSHRGRGIGVALMREVARAATEDFQLDHLHLELRAEMGLEDFYERLGWTEIGRWPAALRLDGGVDRDMVLMSLSLH